MAPAEFDSSVEKQVSQNSAIEVARPDIRDADVAVNDQLQGKDAPMVNAFIDTLKSSDARDLPALLGGDNDFNRFRQQLEERVFPKEAQGKVSPNASVQDIAQLQDINNAMIAVFQNRRQTATKELNSVETMRSFNS